MRFGRHPTDAQLEHWLDRGEPNRVTKHVNDCERCLAALESLSGLDDALVTDLGDALAAPSDIGTRTTQQVERRLRDEAAFTTFLELFTVGWAHTRTVLDLEEDGMDRRRAEAASWSGNERRRMARTEEDRDA
jgi:hypothetical protein